MKQYEAQVFEETIPFVDEIVIPRYRYDHEGVYFEVNNRTVGELKQITSKLRNWVWR